MLNATDWIILSITAVSALVAIQIFKPSTRRRVKSIKQIHQNVEQEKHEIDGYLSALKQSARDAEYLADQLKSRVKAINSEDQRRITQTENAERLLERARDSEAELRQASSALGERLNQIQGHWDEQLSDTIDSVKQVREQLQEGLTHVDDGLTRMRDQEHMAQEFTKKLIVHYQEQADSQQEHSKLSSAIQGNLEDMLTESKQVLEQIRGHQDNASLIFNNFSSEMNSMENQASEHFSRVYQSADDMREELKVGLDEARHHLETLRRREEQSNEISQRIRHQATKVEGLNIEHLSKTIESTNQLCGDLQENVQHAREALSSFDDTMHQIDESLKYAEAVNQQIEQEGKAESGESVVEDKKESKTLFALNS